MNQWINVKLTVYNELRLNLCNYIEKSGFFYGFFPLFFWANTGFCSELLSDRDAVVGSHCEATRPTSPGSSCVTPAPWELRPRRCLRVRAAWWSLTLTRPSAMWTPSKSKSVAKIFFKKNYLFFNWFLECFFLDCWNKKQEKTRKKFPRLDFVCLPVYLPFCTRLCYCYHVPYFSLENFFHSRKNKFLFSKWFLRFESYRSFFQKTFF